MTRAKHENRSKGSGVYYESHHIVPDFMFKKRARKGPMGHLNGNPNDPSNIVLLTMREHIVAHVLLAKSLVGKRYWAQAASSLVMMVPADVGLHVRQHSSDWPKLSRRYAIYKELGRRAISAARKGKFPAVDSVTGESVGSVLSTHPNVVSGKWIHHCKGKKRPPTPAQDARIASAKGRGNANARILDIDYIKQKMVEFAPIPHTKYGGNFIAIKFVKWFDEQTHDVEFYRFENSANKLTQRLRGLSPKFCNVPTLAKEVNAQHNLGWKCPTHGMGKYNQE